MIGFWIFMIVLTICATVAICTFFKNAEKNFSLWETKCSMQYIKDELRDIKIGLQKLKKENEHDGE